MSEEIKKAETIKDVNKEFCERLEQLKSRSGGVKAFIFLVVDEKKNEDGSHCASCYASGSLPALGALYNNAAPQIRKAAAFSALADLGKLIEGE